MLHGDMHPSLKVSNFRWKVDISVLYLFIGMFLSDSSLVELAKKVSRTLLSGMKVKARSREHTLVFGSVL